MLCDVSILIEFNFICHLQISTSSVYITYEVVHNPEPVVGTDKYNIDS